MATEWQLKDLREKSGRYEGSKTKRKEAGLSYREDPLGAASKIDRCGGQTPDVLGVNLDAQTRCAHYRSVADIVAIKMRCCGIYYACKDCHEALAGHAIAVWPREEWDARAILCGACGVELTIREYLESESRCPECAAGFNPACKKHHHFYFEGEEEQKNA